MTHSFLNKQGLTHFWELIKSKIPFHLTKVLYGGLGNIVVDENGNTLVDENGNTITAGATTSLTVNNIEDNKADAAYSTAMGDHTIATKKGSLAVGNYNQTGDYLFVVGNGNSSQRSNAFMVMDNNAAVAGKLSIGQEGTADNNVVTKKYVDDAIGDVNDEVSSSIDDINDEIEAIHDEIEFKFRNTIRCESITLNQDSVTGWVGSPVQISSPTLSPSDTTDTVRWKSNDVSVANVTSTGAITGISAGTTKVTVSCGDQSKVIKAAIYQELPKNVGLIGYGSWNSSGSLYNINYSITRGYVLAYYEYPIRPGQTIKIQITDGTRYGLYDCGIYTGTPTIVQLPEYTVVQHQNISQQADLGGWWDVGTRSWTNELSVNAYLYICVAFRGGVDGRSETTDAITNEQLAIFQNGDGMKIWVEPEPYWSDSYGKLLYELPSPIYLQNNNYINTNVALYKDISKDWTLVCKWSGPPVGLWNVSNIFCCNADGVWKGILYRYYDTENGLANLLIGTGVHDVGQTMTNNMIDYINGSNIIIIRKQDSKYSVYVNNTDKAYGNDLTYEMTDADEFDLPLIIGARWNSDGTAVEFYTEVQIDDFRIYDSALNNYQLFQIYNSLR